MKCINMGAIEFLDHLKDKGVILIGVSSMLKRAAEKKDEWLETVWLHVKYIIDNDIAKQGKEFEAFGKPITVQPFEAIIGEKNAVFLFTTGIENTMQILHQLEQMSLDDSNECYNMSLLLENGVDLDWLKNREIQWPKTKDYHNEKIIHCCWFSGEDKPGKYQECLESWSKYCPEYDIIEWNAHNYDFTKNPYLKEAYENRAWAFASDYVRLDVVHQYGGIYLDMDVELVRNLDELLKYKAFFCYDWGKHIDLGSAFGAVKGDEMIGMLLKVYDEIHFTQADGSQDRTPQPTRLKPYFEQMGITMDGCSSVWEDRAFLSGKYFSVVAGLDKDELRLRQETYGLHWHNAGWYTKEQMEKKKLAESLPKKLRKIFVWRED